jgi:hypothetical protein
MCQGGPHRMRMATMAVARGVESSAAYPARNLDNKQRKEVRDGSFHQIRSSAARGATSPVVLPSTEGNDSVASLLVGKGEREASK